MFVIGIESNNGVLIKLSCGSLIDAEKSHGVVVRSGNLPDFRHRSKRNPHWHSMSLCGLGRSACQKIFVRERPAPNERFAIPRVRRIFDLSALRGEEIFRLKRNVAHGSVLPAFIVEQLRDGFFVPNRTCGAGAGRAVIAINPVGRQTGRYRSVRKNAFRATAPIVWPSKSHGFRMSGLKA